MNDSAEILLRLLRIALGDTESSVLDTPVYLSSISYADWNSLIELSCSQGVAAIALDGLQRLRESHPQMDLSLDSEEMEGIKYEWFREVLSCEEDAFHRAKATERLTRTWAVEGISTTVLKGAAFAQYYPHPNHRYSCDLDLFIGNDWEKACKTLENEGISICYEIYKDAQFHVNGVYVECHRFLMSIRGNNTLRRFELYLRTLLQENSGHITPPLMFNALLCIEHARGHLLQGPLTLKQALDWILIRRQPVDWEEFWNRCDEFGFTRFAKMFNRLADWVEGKLRYEDLPAVDKKVVSEMLSYVSSGKPGTKSFFQRRAKQFRNTLRSGWKYREFNDVSMPVALFRQVWTHFFDKEVKL